MAKLKNSHNHYLLFSESLHYPSHFHSIYPSHHSLLKNPAKPSTSAAVLLFVFLLLFSLCFILLSFSSSQRPPAPALEAAMVPLPAHEIPSNVSEKEAEFWRQPDGEGYSPCIMFSLSYRRLTARISRERRRFLVVHVSGGLNQQRNQITDAVVIARVLGAALVVPILKLNAIWSDSSNFSDLFDVDHFIKTLRSDLRVVDSLPPSRRNKLHTGASSLPFNSSPFLIRAKFLKQLNEEGVLVLKGLDSKLAKDLPLDLQKLRCKVAFHALRFSAAIRELGEALAARMWSAGPYIAVHLRLEEDVWVRTGCSPGLGPEFDDIVATTRRSRPDLLTGRLNLTAHRRHAAGLCPLTSFEVARLLHAMGAPRTARVYLAGGAPLGGERALRALKDRFPNTVTKETLASEGELKPYEKKSSALAALDYTVALSSDVFVPSHGGNMATLIQGHRAYVGHRKTVRPKKRVLVGMVTEEEVRAAHEGQSGKPEVRRRKGKKIGRDVVGFPVPECMCKPPPRFFPSSFFS